ncbi:MAG: Sec-independent protein translocase protein TatA [Bacillariaceae sp.]|jgi:Sec-independent protein translocase protein TatA
MGRSNTSDIIVVVVVVVVVVGADDCWEELSSVSPALLSTEEKDSLSLSPFSTASVGSNIAPKFG